MLAPKSGDFGLLIGGNSGRCPNEGKKDEVRIFFH
jgi:hypothetical protein